VKKSRNKHDNTTIFHHYKVDVFNAAIDQQLTELNHRFSSEVTELLDLCTSLDPRYDNFDKSKICMLDCTSKSARAMHRVDFQNRFYLMENLSTLYGLSLKTSAKPW
jgi:hypothetical protein